MAAPSDTNAECSRPNGADWSVTEEDLISLDGFGVIASSYVCGKGRLPIHDDELEALAPVWQQEHDSGNPCATINLAWLHFYGLGGLEESPSVALAMYEQLALMEESGDAETVNSCSPLVQGTAINNAAVVYWLELGESGALASEEEGSQKSIAVKLLQRAVNEFDHSQAMVNLGTMHSVGDGVDLDAARALELYQMASDRGNLSGTNNVGWAYESGVGVAEDVVEARRLYKLGADQGHPQSIFNHALFYSLSDEEEARFVMEAMMELESKHKLASCYRRLAELYLRGVACEQNIDKAVQYMEVLRTHRDKRDFWVKRVLAVSPTSTIQHTISQLNFRAQVGGAEALRPLYERGLAFMIWFAEEYATNPRVQGHILTTTISNSVSLNLDLLYRAHAAVERDAFFALSSVLRRTELDAELCSSTPAGRSMTASSMYDRNVLREVAALQFFDIAEVVEQLHAAGYGGGIF